MLPTEVFAEAVAFLRLFDLSELSVTNALCSSLAINASARIRWEQFSDLDFYISDTWVAIYRAFGICDRFDFVACLTFSNEPDLAEFISAAFPNCIFNGVGIWRHATKHTLNAIGRVADSFIITEALGHYRDMSPDDSLNLIRKFRKVKALYLYYTKEVSDDEVKELANVYRGSGIKDLFYYASIGQKIPTKVISY